MRIINFLQNLKIKKIFYVKSWSKTLAGLKGISTS